MIDWQDLLGVHFLAGGDDPAVGLDCWGQAGIVCLRAGLRLPSLERARPSPAAAEAGLAGLERVASACCIGDLLLSDPGHFGYPSHCAVVVAPGLALSAAARHGPYCWPIHRHRRELGVWRPTVLVQQQESAK